VNTPLTTVAALPEMLPMMGLENVCCAVQVLALPRFKPSGDEPPLPKSVDSRLRLAARLVLAGPTRQLQLQSSDEAQP
jgi:hypothetical protein